MYLPALQTVSALENLSCQGTEASLKDCVYDMSFSDRCEVASVVCQGRQYVILIVMVIQAAVHVHVYK